MQTFSPINKSAFLTDSKRLQELTKIRSASVTLLKYKKDRLKLEKKFQDTKDKFAARQKILDREKTQEQKKSKSLRGKIANKGKEMASSGFFDFITGIGKIAVLLWMTDPNNVKAIQGLVNFFSGLFKIIDFFATIGVEGVLGGFSDLVSPDSTTIQRLFAVFKIFGGFFILAKLLRWSNPLTALKDLNKNKAVISRIFKTLASRDFKGAIDGIRKLVTPQIFRKGLGQSIQRVILKVFGKGGLKAVQALAVKLGFKTATAMVKTTVAKGAATLGKRIPFIGPFIGLGINLLLGTPLDVSLVRFAGSVAGEWLGRVLFGLLGAFLGSVIPGAGTALGGAAGLAVGGFIGNLIGEWLADMAYGWLKGIFGGQKKEEPALAIGGIVTRPTRALIGEAGPEAVIPLGQIYNGGLLTGPLGIVASSMIGGIDALLSSMGPIGLSIRPFAQQLLAPYTREFGKKNYTFTSDIAKQSGKTPSVLGASKEDETNKELSKIVGSGVTLSVLQKKEQEKKERYNSGNSIREILADILNNVINLDFTSPTSGNGGGNGGGDGSGPDGTGVEGAGVVSSGQEGVAKVVIDEAKKLGWNDYALASLAGDLGRENGWNRNTIMKGHSDPANSASNVGIISWQGSRRTNLLAFLQKEGQYDGKNMKTDDKTLRLMVRFMDHEMKSYGVWDAMRNAKSTYEASEALRKYIKYDPNPPYNTYDSKFRVKNNATWASIAKQKGIVKFQTGGMISRGDITSQFGNKESFRKKAHEGIDVGIPSGTELSFTLGGKITALGRTSSKEREANGGYGQYMDVKLSDGKIARLAHLSSIPRWVQQGKDFPANTIIAISGGIPGAAGSGRSGGAHLHLEQHTTQKDLAETLNGKVDPLKGGIFSLLRRGGSAGSETAQPSTPSQSTAATSSTTTENKPEASWESIGTQLADLAKLLIGGEPKIDSNALSAKSMDFVQASKLPTLVPDTYIIPQSTTLLSNTNIMTPIPQVDYSAGAFSYIDSSSYLAQRKL